MIPRERVLTALAHEQPDVTPWQLDLTADAHAKMVSYTGDPDSLSKVGNHLAGVEDGFFEEVRPGFWRDGFGIVWNRTIDHDIAMWKRSCSPSPPCPAMPFQSPT